MVRIAPTERYGDTHLRMLERMSRRTADRTDFSAVTDAILAAATEPDPPFITVAGPSLMDALVPSPRPRKRSIPASSPTATGSDVASTKVTAFQAGRPVVKSDSGASRLHQGP
jgi:hypothetical protein